MPAIIERIPWQSVGRKLAEDKIKSGLRKLNPDIFFDLGSRLNLAHPFMEYRQGVFYDKRPPGRKHICAMDRGLHSGGMIPEVPIWQTIPDVVEVDLHSLTAEEIMAQEPPFPMPCFHDPDKAQIKKNVRGDLIMCGWRRVFDKLIAAKIPGITKLSLEAEFGVDLTNRVETCEVPEDKADWEDPQDHPEEGEILEEMGVFEPKPTVI